MRRKFRDRSRYHQDLDDIIILIFYHMVKRNMTKSDMMRASGVCYSTINNLDCRETNFPRFHTLYRLAEAVGCKITCTKAGRVHLRKVG